MIYILSLLLVSFWFCELLLEYTVVGSQQPYPERYSITTMMSGDTNAPPAHLLFTFEFFHNLLPFNFIPQSIQFVVTTIMYSIASLLAAGELPSWWGATGCWQSW